MHLLFKERRGLDEAETANDLGQTPADLVLLSFFDADLGAAAQAWAGWAGAPTLRLASLAKLRHPMSVDHYAEQVIAHARCVIVHLHGGLDYWPYGAEEMSAVCRANGVPLALLAGDKDGRPDERLITLSTAPVEALADFDAYFREGGPENLGAALRLAASLAGLSSLPFGSSYAASKAALLSYTRTAALEWGGAGVRVNAVSPSLALHPFLNRVISDEDLEELRSRELSSRSAETWEVANVIVFLASDYSSYMSGEVVSVSSQHP